MLLGFILDRIAPLATQFDTLRVHMGNIQDLQFTSARASGNRGRRRLASIPGVSVC